MKAYFPIKTPKQYIDGIQIMKSVEKNSVKPLRQIKQRRYQAYLSHSKIGYFPKTRKNSLSTKIKNMLLNIKDNLSFDELV